MSQAGEPGQPPDLIDVFKALRHTLTQRQGKRARRSNPAEDDAVRREQQPAARRASSRGFGAGDADFDETEGGTSFPDLYEKTNAVTLDDLVRASPTRGTRGTAGKTEQPRPKPHAPLTSMTHSRHAQLRAKLRDPASLREAIVLSELLQKPVALRRRVR